MSWIKCSERMPYNGQKVIARFWTPNFSVLRYTPEGGRYYSQETICEVTWPNDAALAGVTHWQPLPEPPND